MDGIYPCRDVNAFTTMKYSEEGIIANQFINNSLIIARITTTLLEKLAIEEIKLELRKIIDATIIPDHTVINCPLTIAVLAFVGKTDDIDDRIEVQIELKVLSKRKPLRKTYATNAFAQ